MGRRHYFLPVPTNHLGLVPGPEQLDEPASRRYDMDIAEYVGGMDPEMFHVWMLKE